MHQTAVSRRFFIVVDSRVSPSVNNCLFFAAGDFSDEYIRTIENGKTFKTIQQKIENS